MLKRNRGQGKIRIVSDELLAHTEHCVYCQLHSLGFLCPLATNLERLPKLILQYKHKLHTWFSTASISQFCLKQFLSKVCQPKKFLEILMKTSRPRSDEDGLIITLQWTASLLVLGSFCLFGHLNIYFCPVEFFNGRVGFCRYLL